MAEQRQLQIPDYHHLMTVAEQTRAQAIRSQLALALTFCSLAEFELQSNYVAQAEDLINKTRQTVETATHHLSEPNHVPAHEVEALRTEIAKLRSRIARLEEHIL